MEQQGGSEPSGPGDWPEQSGVPLPQHKTPQGGRAAISTQPVYPTTSTAQGTSPHFREPKKHRRPLFVYGARGGSETVSEQMVCIHI